MNTALRRGFVIVGFSMLLGAAFVPLGASDWAEGVRRRHAAAGDEGESSSRPLSVVRMVAPVVKETVLMGVPAALVVLVATGIRRARR